MKGNNVTIREKALLKELGFTPYAAFKMFCFAFVFTALALSLFVYLSRDAAQSAKTECAEKVSKAFENIEAVYTADSTKESGYDFLLGRKYINYPDSRYTGLADVSFKNTEFFKVKGQKKKAGVSSYLIRFVRAD
ncbi:MAG: hypothetical protein ACI4M9_01515 [Succinivibrio sp.]